MLTAAQIVTIATTIAKCPGFAQMAGQRLNEILLDLAISQNLDIVRRTATINVLPGVQQYNLPATFLRARECFYNIQGAVFYMVEIDLAQYDQLFTGPNNSAYPEQFAIQIETGQIYFYPLPIIPLTVTLRYMDETVEIANPETSTVIPWFQMQSYLINRLAEKMMGITDDNRLPLFKQENDDSLRQYLRMNNGNTLKTVAMDPRIWRSGNNALKPTKLYS